MNSPNPDHLKEFICDYCGTEVSSRQSLWRHKRKKHSRESVAEKRQPSLPCGLCHRLFLKHHELFDHVKESHRLKISMSTKEFESENEFSQWRKRKENDGRFRFVRSKSGLGISKSGIKRQYFFCHRSSDFKSSSTGKRQPRKNVTNRVGFQCTAFAFARIDPLTGRVEVSYSLDHYKHDHSLTRIPLPDDIKSKAAAFLRENRSFEWILKEIRGPSDADGELQRHHLITRKDLRNLQKTLEKINPADETAAALSSIQNDEGILEYDYPESDNFSPQNEDQHDQRHQHGQKIVENLLEANRLASLIANSGIDRETVENLESKSSELVAMMKNILDRHSALENSPLNRLCDQHRFQALPRRRKRLRRYSPHGNTRNEHDYAVMGLLNNC